MNRRTLISILITIFFFIITGCDNYNLMEQFSTEDELIAELVLDSQKTTLQQEEVIELYPGGGLEPYSFSILVDTEKLYYVGTIGSVVNNTYTAGTSIGIVIVRLTDDNNNSVEKELTIIPPTPLNLAASPAGANTINLSWSYDDTGIISGFVIMRKEDNGSFEYLSSPGNGDTSYSDTALNPNRLYSYYIYAISGDYTSLKTAIASATTDV